MSLGNSSELCMTHSRAAVDGLAVASGKYPLTKKEKETKSKKRMYIYKYHTKNVISPFPLFPSVQFDRGRTLRNGNCRYKKRCDAAVRLTSSEETGTKA